MLKVQLVTILLIKLVSISFVEADGVIDDEKLPHYAECTASLKVVTTDGREKRFTDSKKVTSLAVKSLEVEGCERDGCFYVYKQKRFQASSVFIAHYTGNVTGDYIGFRIRSVEKVPCENLAQPVWFVICIVAGVFTLLAILAIGGIKCYRKYNPWPVEDRFQL